MQTTPTKATLLKQDRLEVANEIIRLISSRGRRFFNYTSLGKQISGFHLAPNGKLWFVDGYSLRRVYVMYPGRWRGFTEGGTLRHLVEDLADFIVKGKPIRNHFGPWPESLCDGDLWGYGKEELVALREELRPLVPALQPSETAIVRSSIQA